MKMGDEIKKSRQYILCATVLRYSYVRKIDDNTVGWGFNFQSQTKEDYQKWCLLVKEQIPNYDKYSRLENLAKVMSWSQLDGYDRYDLGHTVMTAITEAEQKMKDKKDDEFRLYKNSIPTMSVLDIIRKEVQDDGAGIPNMALTLRKLGSAIFEDGVEWIKEKMGMAMRVMELEQEILHVQEVITKLPSEVIEGKIESKDQVTKRCQELSKLVREAEAVIERYGKFQISNVGSLEMQRIYYFVRVIGNWEELNVTDVLTSKQLGTWISTSNTKAYLTNITQEVSFKDFSEKYSKRMEDQVKGVREAYAFLTEGIGAASTGNRAPEPELRSDGHNRNMMSRSMESEKNEQRQVKIRAYKKRWNSLKEELYGSKTLAERKKIDLETLKMTLIDVERSY